MPMPVAEVEWNCHQCKQSFWIKPSKARRKRYCSRACLHASMRVEKPVRPGQRHRTTYGERKCPVCDEGFIARAKTQKYCNQKCPIKAVWDRNKDNSVEPRPCEACGTVFRPRPLNAGRFCSRDCALSGQQGSLGPNWRGGRHVGEGGYVRISKPDHPAAQGRGGYVLEHRIVMKEMIGRYLRDGENVHHKNGDRADNRIENLELWLKRQPPGQRVEDLVKWAREIIKEYGELFPETVT